MRILFCGAGAIGSTAAVLCRNLDATLASVGKSLAEALKHQLLNGALAGDGSFRRVRWDERFVPDPEDQAGQATCEGGLHLPLIGLLGASLARTIQDFVKHGMQRDVMVNLTAVTPTTSS